MLKSVLYSLLSLLSLTAQAQISLDVAQFRNLDKVQGGAEVEIYVTVATQTLQYRQRAPKQFQSSAVVTLQVLKADGQSAFQETVTLKPPTLTDTTIRIKNPLSFIKRINLPAGQYIVRGRVRDQYRSANGEMTTEQPLQIGAEPKTAALTDIVLLTGPALKTDAADPFNRRGYRLTRAPGGVYSRGTENVFFYTELNQAPAGRPVQLHYHLENAEGFAADADAPLTPAAGRPTAIVAQLPFGPLPAGEFTLIIEVRNAARKLLCTQTVRGRRETQDYAPAGAR